MARRPEQVDNLLIYIHTLKKLGDWMNEYVLIDRSKPMFKGAVHGHVSCGGGVVAVGDNGWGVRFVANEKFVIFEIVHGGKGQLKNQSWRKSKAVKKEKTKTGQVKFDDSVQISELI